MSNAAMCRRGLGSAVITGNRACGEELWITSFCGKFACAVRLMIESARQQAKAGHCLGLDGLGYYHSHHGF